ncbi:hypothetical protein [Paracoccus sp. Ld10]|uniref:hypothetical protein n=1 Tax=Paracoccus sp. Ld10 TaxID=649158 RepID=UPI0038668354
MSDLPELYVIGGSNSLMRGGWVHHLTSMVTLKYKVVNKSVGAATSLMGIYRLMTEDIPSNATIIWEYSLNEQNHFRHGQSVKSLIYHCEWFLELCARRGIRVLPVLFRNLSEMAVGSPTQWRHALGEMLTERGLTAFDLETPLKLRCSREGKPVAEFYADEAHYRLGTGFPFWIASRVVQLLEGARVPQRSLALAGRDLGMARPNGAVSRTYENSVVRTETFNLDQPLVWEISGQLLGCFLMAATSGRSVSIMVDDVQIGIYSTQSPEGAKQPSRLLKHLVLWQNPNDRQAVVGSVRMCLTDQRVRPIVQNQFSWHASNTLGPVEAIIGLLIETQS